MVVELVDRGPDVSARVGAGGEEATVNALGPPKRTDGRAKKAEEGGLLITTPGYQSATLELTGRTG